MVAASLVLVVLAGGLLVSGLLTGALVWVYGAMVAAFAALVAVVVAVVRQR